MEYRSLKEYEGREVEWLKGYPHLTELDDTWKPSKCIFVKDYPDTVLLRWVYGKESFLKMIPKAAMYTGDIMIRADRLLVGNMVRG